MGLAWIAAQSDSPRRQLFIRIFKSAVALSVSRQIYFSVSVSDGQSSCMYIVKGNNAVVPCGCILKLKLVLASEFVLRKSAIAA